jgi:intracellular sulfur oxidation DsrE/DsrF family protein
VTTPRRSFLGRLGALFALGAVPASLTSLDAASLGDVPPGPDERWLEATAQMEHRVFVETGTLTDVPGFRRMLNFLDVYNSDFKVPDARLGAVVGVHGGAIALAVGDALWAKYALGERLGVKTAAGAAATANPYRAGSPATVEGLTARGVHVLACNRSLLRFSRELAGAGGDAAAVHKELIAGALPQVQVVPAMIIAVSRAQERGIPSLTVN